MSAIESMSGLQSLLRIDRVSLGNLAALVFGIRSIELDVYIKGRRPRARFWCRASRGPHQGQKVLQVPIQLPCAHLPAKIGRVICRTDPFVKIEERADFIQKPWRGRGLSLGQVVGAGVLVKGPVAHSRHEVRRVGLSLHARGSALDKVRVLVQVNGLEGAGSRWNHLSALRCAPPGRALQVGLPPGSGVGESLLVSQAPATDAGVLTEGIQRFPIGLQLVLARAVADDLPRIAPFPPRRFID